MILYNIQKCIMSRKVTLCYAAFIMSGHVMSYLLCYITSFISLYCITLCSIMLHFVILSYAASYMERCYIALYCIMLHKFRLCYIMKCQTSLCCVMFFHVIRCHVCYMELKYVMLWHTLPRHVVSTSSSWKVMITSLWVVFHPGSSCWRPLRQTDKLVYATSIYTILKQDPPVSVNHHILYYQVLFRDRYLPEGPHIQP